MRAGVSLATLVACSAFVAPQAQAQRANVSCDHIIGEVSSGARAGYRVASGVVAVPTGPLMHVVATRSTPWRYWRKAGLLVRAGDTPVTVSIAPGARMSAAISWGGSGTVAEISFDGCTARPNVWNAYAGGFYITGRAACVPLTVEAGGRTQTVVVGVGRRCG